MPVGPGDGASVARMSLLVALSGVEYCSRAMVWPVRSATSYLMVYQPLVAAVKLADFSPLDGVVKSSMMALPSMNRRWGCREFIQKVVIPAWRKISRLQRSDWLSQ